MDENLLQDTPSHTVTGAVWQDGEDVSLVLGKIDHKPAGQLIAEGGLVLRYAVPMLGPTELSVVPAWFVSERGVVLRGWKAWDIIAERYQLYPRAEIFGLRSDGEQVQLFMRELDFGAKLRLLVYTDGSDRLPLAHIKRLILGEDATPPALLYQTFSV
jgi:hypothetical protein